MTVYMVLGNSFGNGYHFDHVLIIFYSTESWTLNKDVKQLAAFERKVLRRMFGGIKVNENWSKLYNKELMQLFRDLDALSFVRISQLN